MPDPEDLERGFVAAAGELARRLADVRAESTPYIGVINMEGATWYAVIRDGSVVLAVTLEQAAGFRSADQEMADQGIWR